MPRFYYGFKLFGALGDLKRITFAIAAHGSAVILGRGASFLLPPEKRIAFLFVSPLEVRIRNVMEDRGLSEKHARERIVKVEAEHHQFAKKYFQADILNSAHYHLVINTDRVPYGDAARLIADGARRCFNENESSQGGEQNLKCS